MDKQTTGDEQIGDGTIMNTHEVIGDLTRKYNLDNKHAEGIVYAILKGQSSSQVATKIDIALLKGELKGDMASLEAKLTGDMVSLEAKLTGDMASMKSELKDEIGEGRKETSFAIQKLEVSHRYLMLISMANFAMLLGLAATVIASIF